MRFGLGLSAGVGVGVGAGLGRRLRVRLGATACGRVARRATCPRVRVTGSGWAPGTGLELGPRLWVGGEG